MARNNKTKIKICGLRTVNDIEIINRVLPDYAGFVFAESRRRVTSMQAEKMKGLLDSRIQAAGVFVNAARAEIVRLCREGIIDIIQLHGDEDAPYIESLKELVSNPVIKAVRVRTTVQMLEAQALPCDFLLLDAYDKTQYGGNGKSFDWSMIPKLEKKFFLAGGLCARNAATAVKVWQPCCVDVSSGVETNGFKDEFKIKEFIQVVRSVN